MQGNVVTSEQIVRVGQGMTRAQVREMLGSPLLTDMFHADRWDYVFMLSRPGAPMKRLDVKIFFEGDTVARVEAPGLPTEREFIDSIAPNPGSRGVPVLALLAGADQGAAGAAGAAGRGCVGASPARSATIRRSSRGDAMTGRSAADARLRIAVAGASGRMGRMLIEAVLAADDCALVGALDVAGSPALGQDAAAIPRPHERRRDHVRPARRPRDGAGADRLHPPRGHAGAPRRVSRARRQGGDRHHRASATRRRPRSPRCASEHRDRDARPT